MKKIALILILYTLFISFNNISNSDKRTIIKGFAKNSILQHISLNHAPRIRGNLNFDNFKSAVTYIDSNGNFEFNSNNITDGAIYNLEFNNHAISLNLFKGDDIQLEFDIDNPKASLFVRGKGAGKINTLNLQQFAYDNFDLENNENLSEFNNHIQKVISKQLNLLNSIFFKNKNDKTISQANNIIEIQKIISDSPLSEKEYKFLLNRSRYSRYSLTTSFLSKISEQKSSDSIEIDFSDKAFENFNSQEYKKLENINDWHFVNSLESVLKIEYLKKLSEQDGLKITYGNWQSFYSGSNYQDYFNWYAYFLKDNFNQDIYNNYFANLASYLMLNGLNDKIYYEKLDTLNQKNKYLTRLKSFKNLLNNGLDNEEYGLNKTQFTLNSKGFNSLLEKNKGKPLFIIFWSAQHAGASIINNLPIIKEFEDVNGEKVSVINICIDKKANKKLWAARIIDNAWKSEHYFLSIEGNESTLNKFSDKKISAMCYGGATYTYIDKNGTIKNGVPFPFHKSSEEIKKMID